jgi:sporadic carbohydrate cluster protein (TIGR04323 family)
MSHASDLANWENKILDYDLERYPWPDWVLEVIQEIEPGVQDLARFHEVIPVERTVAVTRHVQQAFSRTEFMRRFDDFAEEYGRPLIDGRRYMIKRQATLNLVVPNQQRLGRLLPFHQGVWYSNGRGQRTIWCALTPCFGTNSMWVVDTDASRRISRDTIEKRWNQAEFERASLEHARPVEIQPGQCHLFQQEIIHGNVNNDTDVTRMAIDWHLLVEGEEYSKRLPGGFFRLPGDHRQAERATEIQHRGFIEYTGNNTQYDRGIPQLYQRAAMDQYCREHGIEINCVQFENEHLTWMPILEKLIQDGVPGIVMGSIWSLPDDDQRRREILELALSTGTEMHFANEYLILRDRDDLDLIETYRTFAVERSGPHSWDT